MGSVSIRVCQNYQYAHSHISKCSPLISLNSFDVCVCVCVCVQGKHRVDDRWLWVRNGRNVADSGRIWLTLRLPCHAMLCHAMPCLAMPCHALPCYAMPCPHLLGKTGRPSVQHPNARNSALVLLVTLPAPRDVATSSGVFRCPVTMLPMAKTYSADNSNGGMTLTGKSRKTRRETCPSANLSTKIPTCGERWVESGHP